MSYLQGYEGPTGDVLEDVKRERERQDELKRQRKFHWTAADPSPDSEKFSVLSEEVGEVARLVVESLIDITRRNPKELKKELIQVAAVAVAWVESIDAELRKP